MLIAKDKGENPATLALLPCLSGVAGLLSEGATSVVERSGTLDVQEMDTHSRREADIARVVNTSQVSCVKTRYSLGSVDQT